jgi:single-strand DNA-binding protein
MSNVFTAAVRVGKDPEQKTVGQSELVSFSGACDTGYGEKKVTMWINCNIWGKQGTSLKPYIKKGDRIMVSGEFSAREYDAKDGTKKTSFELKVNMVELLGNKKEEATAAKPAPAPQQSTDVGDDLPF